jgi:hypothetical protein
MPQLRPQPPQFIGSVATLTHIVGPPPPPPQTISLAGHVHTPAVQVWPVAHA